MRELDQLIEGVLDEARDDGTKKSLIAYITSNFYRVANNKKSDPKSLILLVGAIALLNIDDSSAINAARKLAQLAQSNR